MNCFLACLGALGKGEGRPWYGMQDPKVTEGMFESADVSSDVGRSSCSSPHMLQKQAFLSHNSSRPSVKRRFPIFAPFLCIQPFYQRQLGCSSSSLGGRQVGDGMGGGWNGRFWGAPIFSQNPGKHCIFPQKDAKSGCPKNGRSNHHPSHPPLDVLLQFAHLPETLERDEMRLARENQILKMFLASRWQLALNTSPAPHT